MSMSQLFGSGEATESLSCRAVGGAVAPGPQRPHHQEAESRSAPVDSNNNGWRPRAQEEQFLTFYTFTALLARS